MNRIFQAMEAVGQAAVLVLAAAALSVVRQYSDPALSQDRQNGARSRASRRLFGIHLRNLASNISLILISHFYRRG
jgi:hypothetical protein